MIRFRSLFVRLSSLCSTRGQPRALSLSVRVCSELKRRAKADKKAKEKEAKKVG